MNIRKLYYLHHRFAVLKAWYLLVPAIIFTVLAVHNLRSNYSTMVDLRENVYVVDKQNGDIEAALSKLRGHVYSHMNTNLSSGSNSIKPPIQLKARYERLTAGEADRVKATNAQVAARGEQVCGAQFPAAGFNAARVSCVQQHVSQNAVTTSSVQDSLYKFDFVSPRWSPDAAGYSILLSAIFYILFIARLILERIIRHRIQ